MWEHVTSATDKKVPYLLESDVQIPTLCNTVLDSYSTGTRRHFFGLFLAYGKRRALDSGKCSIIFLTIIIYIKDLFPYTVGLISSCGTMQMGAPHKISAR